MSQIRGATLSTPPPVVAQAMARACVLAEAMRGATAPNPPVGCVLLDGDDRELAAAAHEGAGRPHAEALALARAREAGVIEAVRTAVVTLEPCNHWGRTPPCTEALLSSPVQTVWAGVRDPNPRVAGAGLVRLSAAGVSTHLADPGSPAGRDAARLIAPFAKWATTGRPWVTVKQALDPGGGMIPPAGRTTFTSADALRLAHALRRRADAILTGSGTILADAPAFTVRRLADHPGKRRRLAILDRRGRVPDAYLQQAEARGLSPQRAEDLEAALAELGRAGVLEVLVEAGPTLTSALLQTELWDEHVLIRQLAPGQPERVETRWRATGEIETFQVGEAACSPA